MLKTQPNTLFYGDNLDVLRKHFDYESVDLIYLDPPFNSKADYNVLFKEPSGELSVAQIRAFSDFWHWDKVAEETYLELQGRVDNVSKVCVSLVNFLGRNDMSAYLVMMAIRLAELHKVLKSTGSLYIHCDPTASHYLKIVLDAVFGPKCFRNEIIWRRTGAHGAQKTFGPIHDTILFYTKTDDYYFNVIKRPYMRGHVESRYTKEPDGRLKFTSGGNVLTGAGKTGGESGQTWRGFDPSAKNRHWAVPGFLTDQMPDDFKELGVLDKLETLYKAGLIEIVAGTEWPVPVRYLDPKNSGQPIQDIWAFQPYTEGTVWDTKDGIDEDIKWLGPTDPERLGYPTQKPLGLLRRIIESSCPPDGVILDPFCGCGTTVMAAQEMKKKWFGIDITHLAITLIKSRLKTDLGAYPKRDYAIIGEPTTLADAKALAEQDKFQFEWWALSLLNAIPSKPSKENPLQGSKGAEGGVDGWLTFREGTSTQLEKILIQVKGGANIGAGMVRDLKGAMDSKGAKLGILITLYEPTEPMVKTAREYEYYESPTWGQKFPKVQIITIEDLLSGKTPDIPDSTGGAHTAVKKSHSRK